jgi:hypothetical protein
MDVLEGSPRAQEPGLFLHCMDALHFPFAFSFLCQPRSFEPMCFIGGISCFLVALLLLVDARPQGFFPLDASDSLWSGQVNDPVTDVASKSLFLDSNESTSNPVDEGGTTDGGSNTFLDLDNLFASSTPLDLSAPPNCDAQGSLTDGLLQARDGGACAPKIPAGTINLPTELFQDPASYLQREFQTPPQGQTDQPDQPDQPDQSAKNDEDLNFGAFLQNRPSALIFKEDSHRCPSSIFRLSNTPVCDNPHTGNAVPEPGQTGFSLYNVAPCRHA